MLGLSLASKTIRLQLLINYKGRGEMKDFHEFGGILQYAQPPLLQLHELILLNFPKGHRIEVVLDQLLEPFPVESKLILFLSHSCPPEVGFVLKIEHCKSCLPLFRALEGIEQLLHTPNSILEGLVVEDAIVDQWVVTGESFKHMGVVLLHLLLLRIHQFLKVLILSL